MNRKKILTALSFLILGIFSILKFAGILHVSEEQIFGSVLIFYSLPAVYFSLDRNWKANLAWSTILFCTGVVLLVESYFEILDTRGIVFTSVLFTGGAVFFLLFIDNIKEKIFLAASLTLMLLSYLSATHFREWGLFNYANKIGDMFEVFWPVALIVFGLSVFINRKR